MKRFLLPLVMTAGLVLSAVNSAFAGRVPQPGVDHKLIAGYATVAYHGEYFRGGELAVIAVEGDGDSNLDLYVYDENGNLIASDTGTGDFCVVRFTPRWTGAFTIKVVNRGYRSNVYSLSTN